MVAAYASNPGTSGDTTADLVLGQVDFVHAAPNHPTARQLIDPGSVAIDLSVTPNRLYVVDTVNNRVLGFSSVAALVNGEPADLVIGQPDFFSRDPNHGGLNANSLNGPEGAAVDPNGNLYVADSLNNRVLEYPNPFNQGVTAALVFGQPGFTSNSPSTSAVGLDFPSAVAVDAQGNLYVADRDHDRVLEYDTPAATANTAADVVFGQRGAFNLAGCNNGGLDSSSLCVPSAVALDSAGNLYVADTGNNRVLEYDHPLANDTIADMVFGQSGSFTTGVANNGGISADSLSSPVGVAVDASGNLYTADTGNNRGLEYDIPASSRNTTADRVYGQSGSFTSDGNSTVDAASLNSPQGVAVDAQGHLYISDSINDRMLEFDTPLASATASLVLGQVRFDIGTALGDPTTMSLPAGVALDTSVSPNRLYVADFGLNRVLGYRSVAALTNGGPADLVIGQADGFSTAPNFDGISADSLNSPSGVAVDSRGNLYVADTRNNRVLEYNSPFTTDTVADMVFGTNGSFTTNINASNPSATSLASPTGVAVAVNGNVYIADSGNNRVLGYVDPLTSGNTTAGIVLGQDSFTSNASQSPSAQTLVSPYGVTVDASGNVYVADSSNGRALVFSAPVASQEQATLVFGTSGSFTVGGQFSFPTAIAIASSGAVYILDRNHNRALGYSGPTVDVAGQVFGQFDNFSTVGCNDSPSAKPRADTLCESRGFVVLPGFATGLAIDSGANMYIADSLNNRVLVYLQPPPPSVPAVAVVPSAINFGEVQIATADSRAEQVNNNQSVGITANFSLSGSSDFFAQSPSCSVPSDSQCAGNIIFAPSKIGPQSAQLTVTLSGPGGGPFTIPLSGDGVVSTPTPTATPSPAPTATPTATATATPTSTASPVAAKLAVSPLNLIFGRQPFAVTGNPSGLKRVTLVNRGRAMVSLRPPSIVGNNPGDFQISGGAAATLLIRGAMPQCGASLAPHRKCALLLRFQPTNLGPRSAGLVLGSNALKGAPVISLSGQGAPPRLLISPGTLDFGEQKTNTTSVPQQIVLNNRNPVPIEIQDISVDNGEFAADQTCVGILDTGAKCAVEITFTPTAPGKSGAFLSIRDNAAGFIQQIRLSGSAD